MTNFLLGAIFGAVVVLGWSIHYEVCRIRLFLTGRRLDDLAAGAVDAWVTKASRRDP